MAARKECVRCPDGTWICGTDPACNPTWKDLKANQKDEDIGFVSVGGETLSVSAGQDDQGNFVVRLVPQKLGDGELVVSYKKKPKP